MGKANLSTAIKIISSEMDSLSPNLISILQDDQKKISRALSKLLDQVIVHI